MVVEDDAELRSLTAALLEEEQLDTIECESAEAALAILLTGGQDISMIFADGMGGQAALAATSYCSHLGTPARARACLPSAAWRGFSA